MFKVVRVIAIISLLFQAAISYSQVNSYLIAEGSNMEIEGTSNVRDWGIDVNEINGKVRMSESLIESIKFTVLTETFEGQMAGMGSHIRKAVKQEKYPELSFLMKEVESFQGEKAVIKGNLTIAGVTRLVEVEGSVTGDENVFEINGQKSLKMTDFNIEPPKAMFGTIKAVDDILVKFRIVLNKES